MKNTLTQLFVVGCLWLVACQPKAAQQTENNRSETGIRKADISMPYAPVVQAVSNTIFRGDDYRATIALPHNGALASCCVFVTEDAQPYDSLSVAGSTSWQKRNALSYQQLFPDSVSGELVYQADFPQAGRHDWGGLVEATTLQGDTLRWPFKGSYQVLERTVAVSPVKMNVFYVGVENPIAVSVPGVDPRDIIMSVTNGSISKKGDGYIVRTKRPGKALLTVAARINGRDVALGSQEFRVKKMPDPVAKMGGKRGGDIPKTLLLASRRVDAILENFDFDAQFRVTQFTVSRLVDGYWISKRALSDRITSEQVALLRNIRRGDKVFIDDIKAVGPDRTVRDLSPMSFRIE